MNEHIQSRPITAAELEALLADLVPIGRDATGATTRLAWTPEDARAAQWFAARAEEIGLAVRRDPAGNLWATPPGPGPWWAAGSHLDTVFDGGRFDGALGVAAAFAVAAREPIAVISFADEEGARFNTPTFGSRALSGQLKIEDALARTDRDGITLRDALSAAGVDPDRLSTAPEWMADLHGFVELHIDQSHDVSNRDAAAAVVGRLAARLRLQADLDGRADHAGTTPRSERSDALAAAARLIVRADDLAADGADMVFTAARIEVEPNAPTTVPARARLWLDARAPEPGEVERWRARLEEEAAAVARATDTSVELRERAWSAGTAFSDEVRAALEAAVDPAAAPVVCYAGHDAGILAAARPTGMVLVRNPTGVSHAPEEDVSLEDAAIAANAMLEAMRGLTARESGDGS